MYKAFISLDEAQARKKAFTNTFNGQGYDVLLTLTFEDGATIQEDLADHILDIYLAKLDRLYFGKINGKQIAKIEREIFREKADDKGNRFIHYHILLKSIGNRELFEENTKQLWQKYIANAQTADVRFYTAAGHYGIKKDWRHGDIGKDTWLDTKGHTDKGTKAYSQALEQGESKQALQRIMALHFNRLTTAQTKAKARQAEWRKQGTLH